MNIEVTKDSVIILENSDTPHENEYKITECRFNFDDFTNSFQVKRAIFTILSTGEMYETDIINNKCDIPAEVLKHEYEIVKLGVYGFNIDENDDLANRFSPSYAEFTVPTGSYEEGALSPEIITPTQYDLYSQTLQEGLEEVNDKLDDIDEALINVNEAIIEVNDAIEETNNLNLNVSDKVDGDVTVTLTKKDATTKSLVISDGTSLQFMWQGTSLGIKTDDMSEYVFVDLQGIQGVPGPQGEPFRIKKTYPSVADMNADFDNMEYGDYVMIASTVEVEDNAKLYTRGEQQWIFITDFSGATGIKGETGATPNIQIGTVTSGSTPNVTRTGTDENPILNFVLQPGQTGPQGQPGATGDTGNGIASIEKTSTSGLVDTYTITFTNGQTTTYEITNGANGNVVDVQVDGTSVVDNGIANIIGLTQMKQELEDMYNLLPKVSGTGEAITLDGTVAGKMLVDLKGNASQETTTGANLVNFFNPTGLYNVTYDTTTQIYTSTAITGSWGGLHIYNSNTPIEIPVGTSTYYYSADIRLKSGTYSNSLNYFRAGGTITDVERTSTAIENPNMTSSFQRYVFEVVYVNSGNTSQSSADHIMQLKTGADNCVLEIKNVMISTTNTTYEPYTNGASPNPDYPQDIHVVSGDNTIEVVGKNLLKYPYYSTTMNVFTDNGDGSITINGTTSSNVYFNFYNNSSSDRLPLKAGTYTFSTPIVPSGVNITLGIRDKDGNAISGVSNFVLSSSTLSTTRTINQDFEIFGNISAPSGTYNNITIYPQLEKSSTATTYEEYKGASYPITLPEGMFLGWIPNTDYRDIIFQAKTGDTYYDSLDSTTKESLTYGKWYVNKQIGKVVLNGSEAWTKSSNTNVNRYYIPGTFINTILNVNTIDLISDYFTCITPTQSDAYNVGLAKLNNTSIMVNFDLSNISFDTLEKYKTWLSTHNTEVYYVLATPTTTEITDATLISQLDTIKRSYDEQTNITQVNNDLPFILDVTALKQITQ